MTNSEHDYQQLDYTTTEAAAQLAASAPGWLPDVIGDIEISFRDAVEGQNRTPEENQRLKQFAARVAMMDTNAAAQVVMPSDSNESLTDYALRTEVALHQIRTRRERT